MLLLLTFCSFSILAQDYGSLRGRLRDEFSGDPIKYARLFLETEEGVVAKVVSDCEGDYRFERLAEGNYSLVINKQGYSPLKIVDVFIAQNQDLLFNPSFEGEGYDQDTLVFTYAEMQGDDVPTHSFIPEKVLKKKQQRAARKLD